MNTSGWLTLLCCKKLIQRCKAPMCSVTHYVLIFVTPCTVTHQAPLSVEFSRQEYWLWLAVSFCRGSCWPRDQTCVSWIVRWSLCHCVTWEGQNKYTPIKSNCKKKWCITKQISDYIYILIFKSKVVFMNLRINSFSVILTFLIIQCLSFRKHGFIICHFTECLVW